MRTTRKKFLQLATIFSGIDAIITFILFVVMLTYANNIETIFTPSVEVVVKFLHIQNTLNLTLVLLAVGTVVNLSIMKIYKKYISNTYYQFKAYKVSASIMLLLQGSLGVVFFAPMFMTFALIFPASKEEKEQIKMMEMTKVQYEQFLTVIGKDPILFSMSIEINLLKHKLFMHQISRADYFKLLNEIISKGANEKLFR